MLILQFVSVGISLRVEPFWNGSRSHSLMTIPFAMVNANFRHIEKVETHLYVLLNVTMYKRSRIMHKDFHT